MFIVGRAVAGFGAAGIIIGAITIISGCAPLDKRPGMSNTMRDGVDIGSLNPNAKFLQ
jgi:MFS family permease